MFSKLISTLLFASMFSLAHGQSTTTAVTQANISKTICVSGYTAKIRPPVSYTNVIKKKLMSAAGISWNQRSLYELDHVVPLSLGGSPRDSANLKLQPWEGPEGAKAKDVVESALHKAVCSRKVTLVQAQLCMSSDWKTCRQLY